MEKCEENAEGKEKIRERSANKRGALSFVEMFVMGHPIKGCTFG